MSGRIEEKINRKKTEVSRLHTIRNDLWTVLQGLLSLNFIEMFLEKKDQINSLEREIQVHEEELKKEKRDAERRKERQKKEPSFTFPFSE
jgi:hypothetical protein